VRWKRHKHREIGAVHSPTWRVASRCSRRKSKAELGICGTRERALVTSASLPKNGSPSACSHKISKALEFMIVISIDYYSNILTQSFPPIQCSAKLL